MPKILDAPNGEKTTLDGTEAFAITGSQYALVSSVKNYARTALSTDSDFLDLIDPYGLHHRISGSSSDDDEFTTDTSANYSSILPTGTANWSVANHNLNVQFDTQSGSDIAAFVKALTLTDGGALETNVRISTENLKNYTVFGLLLTDGTLTTSGIVTASFYMSSTADQMFVRCDGGTVTNVSGSGASATLSALGQTGSFRIRLKRVSSTSYIWSLATEPGGLYYSWGVSGYNPSITPTHGGVFVSTFGGTHKAIASFDYLRHV